MRLTLIHHFPNGNGRHARLASDLLPRFNGAEEFTRGRANFTEVSAARKAYIDTLRLADEGDISLLLQFARS